MSGNGGEGGIGSGQRWGLTWELFKRGRIIYFGCGLVRGLGQEIGLHQVWFWGGLFGLVIRNKGPLGIYSVNKLGTKFV